MLTAIEAAERLGISKSGLLKLVERGTLKASRFGNAYAFAPRDVERAKSRPAPGRPKMEKSI